MLIVELIFFGLYLELAAAGLLSLVRLGFGLL